ncbi:hypothetical protein [Mycobacteroides abscessus]|uniref:hypothetical protein n=1 Tax=Mycobacteroides abscessus TaxID=36809 RepID=UPI000F87EF00|nr:hypothetical protein [Mycobacteroides abscessus]MDM3920813.1 hypothetical protein [Mycobacteroides abscessus]MDO2965347.1 hypothetical protein [Mycobacteroides abscessus subsp. abscessus]MDO3259932.1 hypothetical protein [Mycobacteroides abscessus subsp. abscessus]MDO3309415.1 hypothetical protein [Mycobacteroides abscessus subsp. abscessus]RTZ50916.1 hypothetical protein CJN95_008830 [Mycobacteroides abscessus subsp. abscessus]
MRLWLQPALTGLSLLLGMYILRVNQKDKRKEQAGTVTFTTTLALQFQSEALSSARGTVFNASSAPITDVSVGVAYKKPTSLHGRLDSFRNPNSKWVVLSHLGTGDEHHTLAAGEQCAYIRPVNIPIDPNSVTVKLLFVDAGGRNWERDLSGNLREFPPPKLQRSVRFALVWVVDAVIATRRTTKSNIERFKAWRKLRK